MLRQKYQKGFTIVELLVAVTVLVLLSVIVITSIGSKSAKESTYEASAKNGLQNVANAVKLQLFNNNSYPTDTAFGIPDSLRPLIYASGANGSIVAGPWPNSYYDYDYWKVNPASTGPDTVQASIRYCLPADSAATCTSQAPLVSSWATSFDSADNAYYLCIKGYCRPKQAGTTDYPGYCVNCPNHLGIKYPSEP